MISYGEAIGSNTLHEIHDWEYFFANVYNIINNVPVAWAM